MGKIISTLENPAALITPPSGSILLFTDINDGRFKSMNSSSTISDIAAFDSNGNIPLTAGGYLTGSGSGTASRLDMNRGGTDGIISLTTDGATGLAARIMLNSSNNSALIGNLQGNVNFTTPSAIFSHSTSAGFQQGSNSAIINGSSIALIHSAMATITAPIANLISSGGREIGVTTMGATLMHDVAISFQNGSNSGLINSSAITLTHTSTANIVAPIIGLTAGINSAIINNSSTTLTHGTIINLESPTTVIGDAIIASFNAGLTKIDATIINIGDPTLNTTSVINIGTNALAAGIVMGSALAVPSLTVPFIYGSANFTNATIQNYIGSAIVAQTTVGSAVGTGYHLMGLDSQAIMNSTFAVDTVIGGLIGSSIMNSGTVNLFFGGIHAPSFQYSSAATTTSSFGTYSQILQAGAGVWTVGTHYNYFSESPILRVATGGSLLGTTIYGYYNTDYSLVNGDVYWLRNNQTTYSGTWTNVWSFFSAGAQGAIGQSYIGNGLGVGFATQPTGTNQIQGWLHVGPTTTNKPAIVLTSSASILTGTPINGGIEYDGTSFYGTIGTTRSPFVRQTDLAYRLLAKVSGANFNTTADTIVSLGGGTVFIIKDVIITNPSTTMTAAADGQIWTGTSRSANKIAHTNAGAIPALVNATSYIGVDPAGASTSIVTNDSNTTVGNTLYFSLGTPQGATATADIYVYGYVLQ